jgi:hypothetical protein
MRQLAYIGMSVALLTSCVNHKKMGTVTIKKGQHLYRTEAYPGDEPAYKLQRITTLERVRAKQKKFDAEKGRFEFALFTTDSDTIMATCVDTVDHITGTYFPDLRRDETLFDCPSEDAYDKVSEGETLRYVETMPVFQPITIPLKIRMPVHDTIRSNASAAFSVAVAYGYKSIHTRHSSIYSCDGTKTYLNTRTKKTVWTPGVFLGTTTVDLKPATTDKAIPKDKDRTAWALSTGVFGVVGINQVNVGLACGVDIPFGDTSEQWIYYGKPWLGVIVGLDLIK